MGLGAQPQLGSRNIFHNVKYPHLSSETVFTALKLTQNFYLHYNISVFLERPSLPFGKIPMKAREQKSQFSNVLSELEKIWKCNLGWSKIPISILIYELETKFWIYGWFGKSHFTVENKMENSHRKEWSHFKLSIARWLRYSIP